jgi:hypothetical protein
MVDAPDDERWTMIAEKAALYHRDTFFREGAHALRGLEGGVFRLTILLLKPDAVVSGRLKPLFDDVLSHGFTPVYAEAVTFDRLTFRSLWWYQHNAITLERLALMSRLVCSTPSLLVLFTDDHVTGGSRRPASVRLTSIKGSADPARQEPGQLRYGRVAADSIFTLVHTPDEPIDVVREFAILIDETRWAGLIARLSGAGADVRQHVYELISALESRYPHHSLDPEASRQRLRSIGIQPERPVAELLPLAADAEHLTRWDLFTVIGESVHSRRAGETALVATVPAVAWECPDDGPAPC